jgi:hypothetical protein
MKMDAAQLQQGLIYNDSLIEHLPSKCQYTGKIHDGRHEFFRLRPSDGQQWYKIYLSPEYINQFVKAA